MTTILGIDIGGTGIKSALVDVGAGELVTDRHRTNTPKPATAEAVGDVLAAHRDHFSWGGSVGCAYPGVVRRGKVLTAANLDKGWIGLEAESVFGERLGSNTVVLNDADAAGLAEVRFGAAKDVAGTAIVITVGTGIGTAIFSDGKLVPNTELGHLVLNGSEAEDQASTRVKEAEDLGWQEWAERLSAYLVELERLLWPDLFVVGGGISKNFGKWSDFLELRTPVEPAAMRNRAGIVGAALAAELV